MKPGSERSQYDVICVGGGLANTLLALFLRRHRPSLRVAVVEREASACGNHTWCFHSGDVALDAFHFLKPTIAKSWASYHVRFPGYERRIVGGYHALRSADLARRLADALGDDLLTGADVVSVSDGEVRLADGRSLLAPVVFEALGPPPCRPGAVAYQKFFGLEVELEEPHGLREPLLMDADLPQLDGYRFFYLLPWDERRLLVEDTRYSDAPSIDREAFRKAIHRYVAERGWRIARELRDESAALPLPLVDQFRATPPRAGVFTVGMAAGIFHPTTGYSLPDAVRVARRLATLPHWDPGTLAVVLRGFRDEMRRRRFFRFLNRMLFRGAAPADRYRILERFYRLPAPLIERFYRAELRFADYVRILAGRPPIPIVEALRCLSERSVRMAPSDGLPPFAKPAESHA
jgi:lycopene beta-cyclase